jgi:hypothetical protein
MCTLLIKQLVIISLLAQIIIQPISYQKIPYNNLTRTNTIALDNIFTDNQDSVKIVNSEPVNIIIELYHQKKLDNKDIEIILLNSKKRAEEKNRLDAYMRILAGIMFRLNYSHLGNIKKICIFKNSGNVNKSIEITTSDKKKYVFKNMGNNINRIRSLIYCNNTFLDKNVHNTPIKCLKKDYAQNNVDSYILQFNGNCYVTMKCIDEINYSKKFTKFDTDLSIESNIQELIREIELYLFEQLIITDNMDINTTIMLLNALYFDTHWFFKNSIPRLQLISHVNNNWKYHKRFFQILYQLLVDYNDNLNFHLFSMRFCDNTAGFFGIDKIDINERAKSVKNVLGILLQMENIQQQKIIMIEMVDSYKKATFVASNDRRYISLSLAVLNMFMNKPILSNNKIFTRDKFIKEKSKAYLFYGDVPHSKAVVYKEEFITYLRELVGESSQVLPVVLKPSFNWLDIGCGPKENGAPTLNLLKTILDEHLLNVKFNIFGTDIYFPRHKYDPKNKKNPFPKIFQQIHDNKSSEIINDITYLNANLPKNDIANSKFNPSQTRYDFISMLKVIHHFGFGEENTKKMKPLLEKANGKEVKWVNNDNTIPKYYLSDTQEKVINNILLSLNKGGYAFLDLGMLSTQDYTNYGHEDYFTIVKRIDENTFEIFDQVIPYVLDTTEPYPSKEFLLDGNTNEYKPGSSLYTKGIKTTYNLTDRQYMEVKEILRQADAIVYFFQSRGYAPFVGMYNAMQAINKRKPLTEVFEIYLGPVKEQLKSITMSNEKKEFLKKQIRNILQRISKYDKSLINRIIDELKNKLTFKDVTILPQTFFEKLYDVYLRIIGDKKDVLDQDDINKLRALNSTI